VTSSAAQLHHFWLISVPSDPGSQRVRRPACTARTWRREIRRCRFLCSPRRFLTATDRRAGSIRLAISHEAGISKRPFADPKRLPVSGPPLRDRRSRPAPSTLVPDPDPARSVSSSLPRPVSRGGEVHRPLPVAVSVPGTPACSPGLAPLRDLSILRVRHSTWFACRKLVSAKCPVPVTPLRRCLLNVAAGSSFPLHLSDDLKNHRTLVSPGGTRKRMLPACWGVKCALTKIRKKVIITDEGAENWRVRCRFLAHLHGTSFGRSWFLLLSPTFFSQHHLLIKIK
jgi:hypothetical protein